MQIPRTIHIRSVVSVVGLIVTLMIAVGAPLGYATIRYIDELASLELRTDINVKRLQAYIYVHSDMWEFQSVRWGELIETPGNPIHQQVFAANGDDLIHLNEHPPWPSMEVHLPIVVQGQEVGSLLSGQSLNPILGDTAIVAFFSILLGSLAFFLLRVLPLRVLDANFNELVAARDSALAADLAKSEFLASMSHEIRTPMNGVLGMVSALMVSDLSGEQRKQVLTIKHSGEALLSLLNDILDLSKIESGRVELETLDFSLQSLLDSVEALWESQLHAKKLSFAIEVAPDVAPVLRGDPTRIRQILFNLIGNAAKFTEEGGVTLSISQQSRQHDKLELLFAVTDTGIGIAPEAQSRLFSKFTQADGSVTRKHGGTGLGLAICKQLVELMDGEIGIESTPDRGATFWFTIHCARGDAQAVNAEVWATATEDAEVLVSGQTLRILVAEDNQVNQAVLHAMLGKSGHHIDMVGNGALAVAAVMRSPYDLVLMDVQMPEMDGVTATRKIRELPGEVSKVPIVALTANAMLGDREKYLDAGMTDYVSKPINPRTLFGVIAKIHGLEQRPAAPDASPAQEIAQTDESSDEKAGDFDDLMTSLDALSREA